MSFWDEKEAKRLFQKIQFYNVPFKKRDIKYLNNIDLLHELPSYGKLNGVKTSKTLRGYTRSYRVEIIDLTDPLV